MQIVLTSVLLFILPALFILVHAFAYGDTLPIMLIIGKWFVFFAVGARLVGIGIRQILRPRASAKREFAVTDEHASRIMRILGLVHLSIGLVGVLSLFNTGWIIPSAIVGAFYYGFMGVQNFLTKEKNVYGYIAIGSSAFVALVFTVVVLTNLG
jgi:hypothetical protein